MKTAFLALAVALALAAPALAAEDRQVSPPVPYANRLLTIELTGAQLTFIGQLIAAQKFGDIHAAGQTELFDIIDRQVNTQMNAPPPAPKPSPAEEAAAKKAAAAKAKADAEAKAKVDAELAAKVARAAGA